MNGGSKIVGLHGAEQAEQNHEAHVEAETTQAQPSEFVDEWELLEANIDADARGRGWLLPSLAVVAVLAWLVGMVMLAWPSLRQPLDPITLAEFIAALCVPPALLGIIWLLAMRTSRAEAHRFGVTARAMRAEANSLERMVAALSRKIENNRAELAKQTNELLALGDDAAERLQAVSNGMADQAKLIDRSANNLTSATDQSRKSLEILLASLPKAQSETDALAQRLDDTGLSAGQHAAALEAQLAALSQRGREAHEMAGGAAERLAAHIARMEATSEAAGARLEQVTEQMSGEVDAVLDRTAQAVDEARKGITAQGEAMVAMLRSNQDALERAGQEGVAALASRIEAVDEAIARVTEQLGAQHQRSADLFASIETGIDAVDGKIGILHETGTQRSQELAASISALAGTADAMAESMRIGDETAHSVIDTAERLLTALDAAAREMDETMPEALDRLDARIGESRTVVAASKPELLALVTAAESTHDAIEAIAEVVANQRDTLATITKSLLENLDVGHDRIANVQQIVDATVASTQRFADEAAPQLVDALMRIRETATTASDQARNTLASVIPAAARKLEQEGADALTRATEVTVGRQLAELHRSTEEAVAAASEASQRLSRHMAAISEQTAVVETRLEEARAEREASDRDNFARRVSLLIEALNSASIDIAKSFSHDVSDSAWAAYLKGDRGVFTRRAVRLLEPGEAREVARLYNEDSEFREQVNRYIHDFEAMLRQILSLRDGSPLGVTLLSSDMGKLYVAMAQAIERLRS
ncbi:hypothetical protein GCM10023219_25260 [Stakelama sediminis]|uniref:ABC-type transporter Mla subunit MlaD n=1 Tax=Stakelama sediminis TaxID=463200 RepID=A0A840YYW7_9SPHN|nr:hypothetical protein [Stakelama sediminis]MBB5718795.1 ABC-type transporter Mla subunit MlaD [Stakelama sediminis]